MQAGLADRSFKGFGILQGLHDQLVVGMLAAFSSGTSVIGLFQGDAGPVGNQFGESVQLRRGAVCCTRATSRMAPFAAMVPKVITWATLSVPYFSRPTSARGRGRPHRNRCRYRASRCGRGSGTVRKAGRISAGPHR
ncbi:MAG: hypothetical protein MZV64_04050 [Ignavibacteriales bacterium]|nr:hypothetical protein [Ignavibacteriales bacterium]